MAGSGAIEASRHDPVAVARLQWVLRFAVGTTAAFVLAEAMGWFPTFLAPVLLATLLVSLPSAPSLKTGLMLVVVMAVAASLAFVVASVLRGVPHIMFGVLGLLVYIGLLTMAQARAKLPALLLLINLSVIPVIVMVAPAQAGSLPGAMTRAMALATLLLWAMWALWPRAVPSAGAPPAGPVASPRARALVGTAIVMPVMLVYLLFGLADALPVLITTVLLVTNLDPRQGALQGVAMMLGNLIGGLVALLVYQLLGIAPSLTMLALIIFLVALAFAGRIGRGGAGAAIAVLTFNSSLIILSSAMAAGPSNSGVWMARLFQFALACAFAIGMMSLAWGRERSGAEIR